MPWCKFFIPKIAAPNVAPDDPDLNEHIEYAKCIKGHVLKNADDWILCENLPAPDAQCWMEGGDTIFSLMARKHLAGEQQNDSDNRENSGNATAQRS